MSNGLIIFLTRVVQLTRLKLHVDQVQKKPDKFNEELLSDVTEENDTGFWKSLTRCSFDSKWPVAAFIVTGAESISQFNQLVKQQKIKLVKSFIKQNCQTFSRSGRSNVRNTFLCITSLRIEYLQVLRINKKS